MSTNPGRLNKFVHTRRSQRLMLRVAVVVAGQKPGGTNFVEQTTTVVVNAHGALVVLKEPVDSGQVLRIRNAKTGEEQGCQEIETGRHADGEAQVGIEFLEPAPRFWHVAFPPDDWSINKPEAKRSGKPGAARKNDASTPGR